MFVDLPSERCVACRADSPRVPEADYPGLRAMIPAWELRYEAEEPRLERSFHFARYREALAFTQRVGESADEEDHHPTLITEARRVKVIWWTWAIHGLHRNDFIMAAKTDMIYEESRAT